MKVIFNTEELFYYYYIISNYITTVLMLMKFEHFSIPVKKNESFLKITSMGIL
jgi:hypothetical protein